MVKVRDYSIKRQLTLMNMLVSGAALLTACTAFGVYQMSIFRTGMVRNLSLQAQLVEANSASSLLFNDTSSARNTLSALKASPGIVSAVIYTRQGEVLAQYWRDGSR